MLARPLFGEGSGHWSLVNFLYLVHKIFELRVGWVLSRTSVETRSYSTLFSVIMLAKPLLVIGYFNVIGIYLVIGFLN